MPRIIAQNRIPRVTIAGRRITSPGGGGGASAGGYKPGDAVIATALPVAAGQTWQDLTVAVPPLRVADFSALYAAQGPLTGAVTSNPQASNAANYQQPLSVAWNNAVYAIDSGGNNVRKKTAAFGPYGATLGMLGPGVYYYLFPFTGPAGPNGSSRLFAAGNDGGSAINGFVRTITDDTTFTGNINVGSDDTTGTTALAPWIGFDTGLANTFLLLCETPGRILRTTNGGTTWTGITSALSTPAVRVWCGAWRNNVTGNIQMIGQAMAIAQSTDQGVTWTVNAAVPNSSTINVASAGGGRDRKPAVAFDWTRRKGYAICSDGAVRSWDLDNPTAGYTTVLAVATFTNAGLFAYTSLGFWTGLNYNASPKPGIWFTPFDTLTPRQFFAFASIPIPTPPNPLVQTHVAGMAIEAFNTLIFDVQASAGASYPANWTAADGVNTFDRWVVADPGFAGGRKPYIRVS